MLKKNKKILIVEDQPSFRKIYRDRLVSDGFEVVEASNAQEAKDLLNKETVDLIMTDIVMPGKSGLEFLSELKTDAQFANIPVIILSVLGSAEDVKRGLDIGASDYLVKGMHTPNDVSRKVQQSLGGSSNASAMQSAGIKKTYMLKINETVHDARKLQADLGMSNGFVCEKCQNEELLEITPHPTHTGWFDAHLVCPHCDDEPSL